MSLTPQRILLVAVATAGLMAGVAFAMLLRPAAPTDPNAQLERATVLFGQTRALPAFSLADQHGVAFDPARLQGRWTLLYFGFTHCPDVCPTTLGAVDAAVDLLADSPLAEQLDVGFVSVDPERDDPEHLGRYVTFFNTDFLGITGSRDDIDRLTRAVGAVYRIEPHAAGDQDYSVDHTSRLMLIDPAAHFHAVFSDPHEPQVLARELRIIADAYAGG